MTTLLLHSRYDDDSQLLWQAAVSRYWSVMRLHGYSFVAGMIKDAVIYGGYMWAPTIAQALGVTLASPHADVMTRLPLSATRRVTARMTANEVPFPTDGSGLFVKSLSGKEMDSRVYYSMDELPQGIRASEVLVQPPITWDFEYRAFVLRGEVLTISRYAVNHRMNISDAKTLEGSEMRRFAESVLSAYSDEFACDAFVLDVGHVGGLDRHGYAVVEANPAWCSGIYGCDPNAVLDVVAASQVAK